MAIEKVEQAVLAEAKAAARAAVDAARKGTADETARANEANETEYARAMADAEARASRETARQVGKARHAGRLDVLAAKNAVLDSVFRRAADALSNLPDAEYLDLMRGWLLSLPAGASGEIRVNPSDTARFSEEFIASVNAARGPQGSITALVPDARVGRGFIFESQNYSVDRTVEHRIEDLKTLMASEVALELFGQ